MKRGVARVLQVVIVLIGIGVLTFMLWEPHIEGRNAEATLSQVYFADPFLAYVYIASFPFFMILVQAFKALGSKEAVKALRMIRYCAMALIGLVAVGEVLLMFGESDDRAGGIFMGMLIAVCSIVIAIMADRFARRINEL